MIPIWLFVMPASDDNTLNIRISKAPTLADRVTDVALRLHHDHKMRKTFEQEAIHRVKHQPPPPRPTGEVSNAPAPIDHFKEDGIATRAKLKVQRATDKIRAALPRPKRDEQE